MYYKVTIWNGESFKKEIMYSAENEVIAMQKASAATPDGCELIMNQSTRRNTMPEIGTKKFSYTKKGKAAAKQEAKKSGKKVMSTKKSGGY